MLTPPPPPQTHTPTQYMHTYTPTTHTHTHIHNTPHRPCHQPSCTGQQIWSPVCFLWRLCLGHLNKNRANKFFAINDHYITMDMVLELYGNLLGQVDLWFTCSVQVPLHQSVHAGTLYDSLLDQVDPWLTCVHWGPSAPVFPGRILSQINPWLTCSVQVSLRKSVQVLYNGLLGQADPWLTCVIQVSLQQPVQVFYGGLHGLKDSWLTCVIQVSLQQPAQVLYNRILSLIPISSRCLSTSLSRYSIEGSLAR